MLVYKKIKIETKEIKIVDLDYICDVRQGLVTGDNTRYLFKVPTALGSYRLVDDRKILNRRELETISHNNELRKKIIHSGIPVGLLKSKTIVPIDKGGSSNIEEGRLSNYYAPVEFYIDWSEKNVHMMKTMTIAERKKLDGDKDIKKSDRERIASRFQNVEYYFKPGITFSPTGLYAPTYKLNSSSIFDHAGDCIFIKPEFETFFSNELLLGILCSKFMRYVQKTFINNTVSVQVDDVKKNPIVICNRTTKLKIEKLVNSIITKQNNNPTYDYQNYEQKEIDQIIYTEYGLSSVLREEIEDWYDRRYYKLILKN